MHPGIIANTNLNRLTPAAQTASMAAQPEVAAMLKSAEQGAATTVWAAVVKERGEEVKMLLKDWQESEIWDGNPGCLAPGYAAHIHDHEAATRLWDESAHVSLGNN